MKAPNDTPEIFVCECGGYMWQGCGVTHGQRMDETLLSCNDCGNEKTVKKEKVEEVK